MIDRAALIRRRRMREKYFVAAGMACIAAAGLFLFFLAATVAAQGWRGFLSSTVRVEIFFDPKIIGENGGQSALSYRRLAQKSLLAEFPGGKNRTEKKLIRNIAGAESGKILRDAVRAGDAAVGARAVFWLPAGAEAEAFFKGAADAEELRARRIPEAHIARLKLLAESGRTRTRFNAAFFTAADSRNAESAGVGGALLGSFYTLLLAFFVSFPVAVLAALYLELFAPRGRAWKHWLDIVEININNLAAVPSVIFGLLGLAVFLNIFHMPRSSPLVGGLVLSLMTLPTIIIAARASIRSAPPSLLAAAMSLGATRMQGVFHHVLPAAMPGILTGAIIGMAQALGETAPLLLIGMVAFIADAPSGITDAATALPVQIFLWADSPERGFGERTAAAILVLLGFLIIMNAAAVILRKKLEIKW